MVGESSAPGVLRRVRATSTGVAPIALILAAVALPSASWAKHYAIARAERAVASGDLVPERDLAPLLEALKRSRDTDEKRELVEAIADLGEADGPSPNVVKSYLREAAPPVLFDVIENGDDPFLQGDAVFALRGMRASRAVLEQAAALAEADPNQYVQSRGQILRGFIRTMPEEDAGEATGPVDPERAARGVAYLDQRGIAVSTESLRQAARRADADSVRALLDAGVAPDTGVESLDQTPLGYALSRACTSQGAETDWLVETVQLLVDAGADLSRTDDNSNTALMLAVHWCGSRLVGLLAAAGVEVGFLNQRNGSGLSALGLALVTGKLDSAEVLVDRGARLGVEEAEMVEGVATDPRAKALFQKARPVER